jgi:ABC-type uncharacterized transport system substrate-binding protein
VAFRDPRATASSLIGFMSSRSPEDSPYLVNAFRRGLAELGFVEGKSAAIEYRWAHGQYERLAEIADEFVSRKVAVIATVGGVPSARAAKNATATIPIVFSVGPDPVKLGLVASLSRPGQLVRFAARERLPALYQFREYVEGGGLISYGISLPEGYRLVGTYVGRILNGEMPSNLPVAQSTTFELVINLKTAKRLASKSCPRSSPAPTR